MAERNDLLTREQVAALLQCSVDHVDKLRRLNLLRTAQRSRTGYARRVRITRAAVEAFLRRAG